MSDTQSNTNSKQNKHTPSAMQSIGIGGLAGLIEVGVDHPLFVIKTEMQSRAANQHRDVSKTQSSFWGRVRNKPSILYTGFTMNAGSIIPITAFQVGCSQFILNAMGVKGNPSTRENAVASSMAGAFSALFSTPAEMIMVQQSQHQLKLRSAVNKTYHQFGLNGFYRGWASMAIRDGIFVLGYKAVTDEGKKALMPYLPDSRYFSQSLAASMTVGLPVGIASAYVSHPFDTIKNYQQVNPETCGTISSARALYQNGGFASFFKGAGARATRAGSATAIFAAVIDTASNYVKNS